MVVVVLLVVVVLVVVVVVLVVVVLVLVVVVGVLHTLPVHSPLQQSWFVVQRTPSNLQGVTPAAQGVATKSTPPIARSRNSRDICSFRVVFIAIPSCEAIFRSVAFSGNARAHSQLSSHLISPSLWALLP